MAKKNQGEEAVRPRIVPAATPRDPRVDLLRGVALLCIFVDHIPGNRIGDFTLRNIAMSDAAELFVLLAGFSAMLAYGRRIERDGLRLGMRRIAQRCLELYLFQIGLLLATLLIVTLWTRHYGLQPLSLRPMLRVKGMARGLTLQALPAFLDILPVYIAMLAAFPGFYLVLHRNRAMLLVGSVGLWAVANVYGITVPNIVDPKAPEVWFLNPLTWQLVFVSGMLLAELAVRRGGTLPRRPALVGLCWLVLAYGAVAMAPWKLWGWPELTLLPDPGVGGMAKSWVVPLRLLSVLAMVYLALTSGALRRAAAWRAVAPVVACGRNSLPVFAAGTLLALFGRLAFRTFGTTAELQFLVNGIGFLVLLLVGVLQDRRRHRGPPATIVMPMKQL